MYSMMNVLRRRRPDKLAKSQPVAQLGCELFTPRQARIGSGKRQPGRHKLDIKQNGLFTFRNR